MLALGSAVGCGGKEVEPPPKECPQATPISGAVCEAVLEKKSCYWDDSQARLRTWCYCELAAWNCFDEPL